jgi:adenylate kinase family enzyme
MKTIKGQKNTLKKIKLPFHIVLLGQVAAGKDTQADLLNKQFEFKKVESGKYWRSLEKENSKAGEMLRKTTSKGLPAPVSLMKQFLLTNLETLPKNKTLLFVGNPRLKPEGQLLHKLMTEKKQYYIVLYIGLTDREVLKRSRLRERNLDDRIYVTRRIAWHKDQVGKTIDYFKHVAPYARINGNQPVEKVYLDIQKKIYQFLVSLC